MKASQLLSGQKSQEKMTSGVQSDSSIKSSTLIKTQSSKQRKLNADDLLQKSDEPKDLILKKNSEIKIKKATLDKIASPLLKKFEIKDESTPIRSKKREIVLTEITNLSQSAGFKSNSQDYDEFTQVRNAHVTDHFMKQQTSLGQDLFDLKKHQNSKKNANSSSKKVHKGQKRRSKHALDSEKQHKEVKAVKNQRSHQKSKVLCKHNATTRSRDFNLEDDTDVNDENDGFSNANCGLTSKSQRHWENIDPQACTADAISEISHCSSTPESACLKTKLNCQERCSPHNDILKDNQLETNKNLLPLLDINEKGDEGEQSPLSQDGLTRIEAYEKKLREAIKDCAIMKLSQS